MVDSAAELERDRALLQARLMELMPGPGRKGTGIAGLSLFRGERAMRLESGFCPPSAGVTVQGVQEVLRGTERLACGGGSYFLNCVGMPCSFFVREASAESPFLSVALELDEKTLTGLMDETGAEGGAVFPPAESGLRSADMSREMLGAFLRLLEAGRDEERARVLGPMIVREIHYYLLKGPLGRGLRNFYTPGSPCRQIAQATGYMRAHFRERLRMETLARLANMAESTFSRNFRKVTSLSPLQFHKHLKLHEARRLMMTECCSAANACSVVGYESRQQFSREYKRLFGSPPMRDVLQESSAQKRTGPEGPVAPEP